MISELLMILQYRPVPEIALPCYVGKMTASAVPSMSQGSSGMGGATSVLVAEREACFCHVSTLPLATFSSMCHAVTA